MGAGKVIGTLFVLGLLGGAVKVGYDIYQIKNTYWEYNMMKYWKGSIYKKKLIELFCPIAAREAQRLDRSEAEYIPGLGASRASTETSRRSAPSPQRNRGSLEDYVGDVTDTDYITCSDCEGKGQVEVVCRECNGTGTQWFYECTNTDPSRGGHPWSERFRSFRISPSCPFCGLSAFVRQYGSEPCFPCEGDGKAEEFCELCDGSGWVPR